MNATPRPSVRTPNALEAPSRALRDELSALADALVDARPADRSALRERASRVEGAYRRARGGDDLGRLLAHIVADLSSDSGALDTLYHARQLVVAAERLAH